MSLTYSILRGLILTLVFTMALLGALNAWAVSSFLDSWRVEYPGSNSGDIRCQLCHLQREGGAPWNEYGRDIRNVFNDDLDPSTRTIEQAFRMVELLNSDNDGANNLSEIRADEQPGWRSGRVNNAYDRDDNVVGTFYPPVTIDPFPEKLPVGNYPIELSEVAAGFTSPLAGVVSPISGLREQLFVVDQVGIVWRVNLVDGLKEHYLDVSNRLVSLGVFEDGGYDERGLLGLAFHPQFSENGLAYLYLSVPSIGFSDFTTLDEPSLADHQSLVLELTISNRARVQPLRKSLLNGKYCELTNPNITTMAVICSLTTGAYCISHLAMVGALMIKVLAMVFLEMAVIHQTHSVRY